MAFSCQRRGLCPSCAAKRGAIFGALLADAPCAERFEPTEFLGRLLQHIPEPRLHQVRYYGRYSNVTRARQAAQGEGALDALQRRLSASR